MDEKDVLKALEEVRKAPKRNFAQSIDLIVNLKNLDFKNPANRIDLKIMLPEGRGKGLKVGVFGDTAFLNKAKNADMKITGKQINKSPKEIRKVAKKMDFCIAQTNLMVDIGKNWGKYLSTRGKMPQPMPPSADPAPMITRLKNTVVLKSKGNTPQTISCAVGTEDMKDEQIAKNAAAVCGALLENLPEKKNNVHSIIMKTTMGSPVKLL